MIEPRPLGYIPGALPLSYLAMGDHQSAWISLYDIGCPIEIGEIDEISCSSLPALSPRPSRGLDDGVEIKKNSRLSPDKLRVADSAAVCRLKYFPLLSVFEVP